MQISCSQDTLAKYLNVVSRVVNTKPGLPILNNVLFETNKGKLVMTVTDLELSLNCWIGADVKADGRITSPAKELSEFVNSVSADNVDMSVDKQALLVSTPNNNAQFNTIPADDYPSVVTVDAKDKPVFEILKDDVLLAVNRVAFAAATDDIKPVMTGIKLEVKGNTLAMVGADGFRLSRQTIKLPSKSAKNLEILVPAKAMQELAYIVSEFSSENSNNLVSVFIVEERNQVVFRYNDIDLISRLIDGEYPAYQQAIPTGYQTKALVSRSEFQNALKVANIIARGVLGNKLLVSEDAKANTITLSATQADLGSNNSSFGANIEGGDMKIAFSSRLLNDMLSHIGAEELVFESSNSTAAGVFKIKGDDTYLHLVMPMRI